MASPNIQDIYDTLWEQVQLLKKGETSAASANAVSNAIGKIFTGIKSEMEFARMTGATPVIPLLRVTTKS